MLTLTNDRVFRDSAVSGQSRSIRITLDAVSSCGLVTNSQPVLLIFGILTAVAGVAVKGDARVALIIAGLVMIVMYVATLSAVVAICSAGGERITVPAKTQQRALLMALVNAIDQEKLVALGRIGAGPRTEFVGGPPGPPARFDAPRGTW